mmetsp:Transcript_18725/g.26405  ORF Transcript_18725/g.26405 Transcript_18725/m.26405 type:complete len:358 (+) Transcript_18725:71-1144(+)
MSTRIETCAEWVIFPAVIFTVTYGVLCVQKSGALKRLSRIFAFERFEAEAHRQNFDQTNERGNYLSFDFLKRFGKRKRDERGKVDAREFRSFGDFSDEMRFYLMQYLMPKDLFNLAQCSKELNRMAESDCIWLHLFKLRFESILSNPHFKETSERYHLHWGKESPREGWNPPQGWKLFYSQFACSWVGWISAGKNLESECLVGINGKVYDVTDFLAHHPGSPETLLVHSGRDSSLDFDDIGHSSIAHGQMRKYVCAEISSKIGSEVSLKAKQQIHLEMAQKISEVVKANEILCEEAVPFCSACQATFDSSYERSISSTERCAHKNSSGVFFFVPSHDQWAIFWPCCGLQRFVSFFRR